MQIIFSWRGVSHLAIRDWFCDQSLSGPYDSVVPVEPLVKYFIHLDLVFLAFTRRLTEHKNKYSSLKD